MPNKFFSALSFARLLFLSATSMLLFCQGFLMPPLGIVALVFSPTPIALLGARENKIWMTLGIIGNTLTLWMVLDSGLALAFLFGYGLLCFGLTLPLGRLEKGSESLLFCVAVSITAKLLFVAVSVFLGGDNPFAVDINALSGMLSSTYSGLLGNEGQDAAYLQEALAQAVEMIPYMLPFFIVVYSMIDSFANYKLCEVLQRKRDVKFPPLPAFGEWRFPTSIIYVFLFAFVLSLVAKDDGLKLWTMLEYNLKLIVNIFFFLQGLALAWWGFAKYAAGHFFPLPLRIALAGLLSLPVFNAWVVGLGMCDMCIDFRTKKIRRT